VSEKGREEEAANSITEGECRENIVVNNDE
jgi:hypothetical protein